MGERTWLFTDVARRVLAQAPPPPATWPSVVRRVVVVAGSFAVGLLLGDLPTAVLICFGALQAGLVEAALPFRRLLSLLTLLTVACAAVVALATLVGGTWLAVVLIAALAYAYGCTASVSERALTVGISALALGVIFAGQPRPPDQVLATAGWVALGLALQSAGWLLLWRPERRWFAQRAIANKLRAEAALLRHATLEPDTLIRAHGQVDVVAEVLGSAQFGPEEDGRLRRAFSSTIIAARAVVAWMELARPGDRDRMLVGLRIRQQARVLEPLARRRVRADIAPLDLTPAPATDILRAALTTVDSGVEGTADRVPIVGPARPVPDRAALPHPVARSLIPGSRSSRHGARMALGVGTAELLTLLYPGQHSFWLPLTVMFVLRPDWSFTMVRGLNRLVGNLTAVILIPVVLDLLGGSDQAVLLLLLIIPTICYRWFFGHYAVASFGLAGSVLLLDFSLGGTDGVFVARIEATLAGALLALLVVLLIPGWASTAAPRKVDALVEALTRWRKSLWQRLESTPRGGSASDEELEHDLSAVRRCLTDLEPTVTGVLVEPGGRGRPAELAMVQAAGSREFAALMAVTYTVVSGEGWGGNGESAEGRRSRPGESAEGRRSRRDLVDRVRLESVSRDVDRAVADYRAAAGP